MNKTGLIIVLLIFLFVGLIFIGIALYLTKIRHKSCTDMVSAKCVKVKKSKSHQHDGMVYCPVYTIYYYGKHITLCNNIYTSGSTPKVGDTRDIYVDPDDPKHFYEPGQNNVVGAILYVIGVCFIIPVLYFFIKIMGQN